MPRIRASKDDTRQFLRFTKTKDLLSDKFKIRCLNKDCNNYTTGTKPKYCDDCRFYFKKGHKKKLTL